MTQPRTLVGGPGHGQTVQLRDDQTWLTLIVRYAVVDRVNPLGPRGIPEHSAMPYEEHRYELETRENGSAVMKYRGAVKVPSVHANGSKRVGGHGYSPGLLERLRIKIKRQNHDKQSE